MIKPVMFGKFCLLERISVGGMAEVFRAKRLDTPGFDRYLAVKRILPNLAEDDEFIQMFIDEAKITVQLNHRNICQIYELGYFEDSHFIVMEFISGRDILAILNRLRKDRRIMSVGQAAYLVLQMAQGLDSAHRKVSPDGSPLNIIHRDVSPQNVLVSYTGEVKIIDFGIAKAASRSSKTQAGVLKGKFGYMSPEQVRGLNIDRRSDIFALGTLFHEMLTCRRLFHGGSDFATLEKVRRADVPPPSQYNPNVPPEIDAIVLKALAATPEERYQWCSEVADDLKDFLQRLRPPYMGRTLEDWMQRTFAENLQAEVQKRAAFASVKGIEDVARFQEAFRAQQGQDDYSLLGGSSQGSAPRPTSPELEDDLATESTVLWDRSEETPALSAMATQIAPGLMPDLASMTVPSESTRITTFDPYAPSPMPSGADDGALPPIPTGMSPFGGDTPHPNAPPVPGASPVGMALALGLLLISVLAVGGVTYMLLFAESDPPPKVLPVTSVKIKTMPVQEVDVLLNGELKATRTPYEIKALEPGEYTFAIRHADYLPVEQVVTVTPGQQQVLPWVLKRKPEGRGAVNLNVSSADVEVYVDGRKAIGSPGKMRYVLELGDRGEHLIEARLDGFFTEEVRLSLKDGQQISKTLVMRPVIGEVVIKSSPPGLVMFDGEKLGMAPQTIPRLSPFQAYALEIRLNGYDYWKRKILFHRSLQKTYSAKLQRRGKGSPEPDFGVGFLTVESPTTWWRVEINGWDGGVTTPIPENRKLALPAGEHKVTFRRGDQMHTKTVKIYTDQTAKLTIAEDFNW